MMVKLRTTLSGLRDGKPWPARGQTMSLPDDEAALMCDNGTAEPVFDPESGVERAVALPAETRLTTEALTPRIRKR